MANENRRMTNSTLIKFIASTFFTSIHKYIPTHTHSHTFFLSFFPFFSFSFSFSSCLLSYPAWGQGLFTSLVRCAHTCGYAALRRRCPLCHNVATTFAGIRTRDSVTGAPGDDDHRRACRRKEKRVWRMMRGE